MKQLHIPYIDLNKYLNKCNITEDLVMRNGLMQRLFGNIIQQFLEVRWKNILVEKNIGTNFGEGSLPMDRKQNLNLKLLRSTK